MKANKKGISLIVLIITIVVIIILAAAIILNLSSTNIIENANDAVTANDKAEVQSAVTLAYGDLFAENRTEPTLTQVATKVNESLDTTKYQVWVAVAEGETGVTKSTTAGVVAYELTEGFVIEDGEKIAKKPADQPEG